MIYLTFTFSVAEWLRTCKFSDPEFTKCSTDSVQGLFTKLATGIDGLSNFETIDPLKINKIKILQGEGPVSVNASLSKVTVLGFSKTKVIQSKLVIKSADCIYNTYVIYKYIS